MGDLTKNLSRNELACRCKRNCGYVGVEFETVKIVQETCDHFAKKLGKESVVCIVTSGARCKRHNSNSGGRPRSRHFVGASAIDFRIKDVDNLEIYNYLDSKYPDRLGLAVKHANPEKGTRGFVHVDSDTERRRWEY